MSLTPQPFTVTDPCLAMPKGLCERGERAWEVIARFMQANELTPGGCKTFYSPQEWQERGEEYGLSSVIVVVYDGGDLWSIMEGEYGWSLSEQLADALSVVAGVYLEACTGWYSAAYPV